MSALSSTVTPVALVRRPAEAPKPSDTYKVALPPARLYANDLDALLRYLVGDGRVVRLRAGAGDSVVLDGADDLHELTPKERRDLRINVIDPAIEVRLSDDGTSWVTAPDPAPRLYDDATKLADDTARLISQWGTGTARLNARQIAGFALLGGMVTVGPMAASVTFNGWSREVFFFSCAALVFVLLVGTLITVGKAKHRVVVSGRTRAAASERRSHMWSTGIVAILGGVAGSVSTWLLALKP